MAKTTIDGLRVRESSQTAHVSTNARRSSAQVVEMKKSPSAKNTQKRQEMIDSIDAIRNQQTSTSSFLDPVETFDFDSTEDFNNQPTEETEADWSELLNDFAPAPKKKTAKKKVAAKQQTEPVRDSDFIEEWTKTDEKEFLTPTDTFADGDEDEDEPKISRKELKKKVRAPKKRHVGRNIAIVTVCLLIVAGGVVYKWGDTLISRLTGGNSGLWGAIKSFVSDEIPFDEDENGRTNVLIFGTEGYNMNGDTDYGTHDGAQLTDSIMVASFNQETKDVALLSLPRDLKVPMACSAGKINEVFWCHNQDGTNEAGGAQALMEQVGDVLGLKFQYYAHINWASLIDIINTLGGITVTLDENIADYGFTGAVAQAGVPMEVNGEQALGLARARHGTQGGDFTRGNTQQKIVEAIISKLLDNGVGVGEGLNLLNILGDNLRSNFSTDNIKAGIHLISGFDMNNIRQIPLVNYDTNTFYVTTATINDVSYVVPAAGANNYSDIQQYVAEMLANNPVVREKARIAIYNASGQYGVAAAERDRLIAEDYDVVSVGDATIGDCPETYCIYNVSQQDFSATAEALAVRYDTLVHGAQELPQGIEPGEVDFIIILGFDGSEV